ncbi:hypothetical protein ACTGJ9_029065 [Bradyrhizobium sp. RDM12]
MKEFEKNRYARSSARWPVRAVSVSPSQATSGSLKISFKNQVVRNLHMIHELERLTGAIANGRGRLADVRQG